MSVGSKPEIFHSDDITSEFLEENLPGRPVASHNHQQINNPHAQQQQIFNNGYYNDVIPGSSTTATNSNNNINNISDAQRRENLYINNDAVAPTSGLESAATNAQRVDPHLYTSWQKIRHAFREPFAEFLGTFVLVMFGDGVVAQVKLSDGTAGNYTTIALSWATAVFLGYTMSAGISGAHLNPGVTLSAAVFRKFKWRKVPGYILGQVLGGYIGGICIYAVYVQSIDHFEGGKGIRTVTGDTASAGLFNTYAQPYLTTGGQVVSELSASAFLQMGIFAMTDPYNSPLGDAFPFGLFLLIYGIGSSFGYQTGYAINLARDFAPRLAAATLGYGSAVFTVYDHYFWVPLVIPIIGCLFGALIYDVLIYQGHDSPINQSDLGLKDQRAKMNQFSMKDMRPDFDVATHAQKSGVVNIV